MQHIGELFNEKMGAKTPAELFLKPSGIKDPRTEILSVILKAHNETTNKRELRPAAMNKLLKPFSISHLWAIHKECTKAKNYAAYLKGWAIKKK